MAESPVRPGEVADQVPADPHGVGGSQTRRGEDVVKQEGQEPGKQTLGAKGASNRPCGTSDPRASTGVDPQDIQGGAPATSGNGSRP